MSSKRRILIDNSTLSGVERITGISKIINLNYIDNDILCLEKLLTAILFSDELIAVDDYKEKFRSERLRNFEFIQFQKIDDATYEKMSSDAAAFAQGMTFSFDGSEPAGDVVRFFESLRIDPQLRWNIYTSSEYLTLAFLVEDTKYTRYENSIESIFRTEGTDYRSSGGDHLPGAQLRVENHPEIKDIKSLVQSLKEKNPQFSGTDGKNTLGKILFGFGWAAERSYFYNDFASRQNSDVFLAPLRDAFCESCCRIDYPSRTTGLLENLKNNSQTTLAKILLPSGQAEFAFRLPFFTSYLISRTSNAQESIQLALELRHEKEFKDCRTILDNLNHVYGREKIKEINGIMSYLEKSFDRLMKKYSVSSENGVSFSISLGVTGINVGLEAKISSLFRSYRNRPFTRVFRNIAQDMLNVERLGGLYEKLCSSIVEHKDANYPRIPVAPKYMRNRENEYGRPAELD